ncbi:MAG: efflux RND transporter permease subunit, partial [Alphaproteobacteria bacterium]
VVVENIHRHIEHGAKPLDAAIAGMRELTGPVIAMTITLAAVFTPIAFMSGLTGALFREFAVALAGSVMISGVVALTLSPMLAGRILEEVRPGEARGLIGWIDRQFERLQNAYGDVLRKALASRAVIVVMVVALLGTTGYLFLHTNTELAPAEDQGALISFLNGPRYATATYMRKYVDAMDPLVGDIPETSSHFTISGFNGDNSALSVWTLKPWDQRKRSSQQIQQVIQRGISKLPGAEGFVFGPPLLPGAQTSNEIDYVIRSIGTPEQVYEVAEEIRAKALASGKFVIVQNSLAYDQPRASVTIDRERAAALNTSVADIGTTLSVLLSNARISRYDQDNRNYDVIAEVEDRDRINPDNLNQYYVRSGSGDMVPLSAVANITVRAGPVDIEQFNQLNSAEVSANPKPGVSEADAIATMKEIGAQVMPAGFFDDFSGEARLAQQEGNTLAMAFGLAILVIYLVLAAQFESFRDPLIIMMAVPCSIFGALVLLNLGSGPPLSWGFASLNIYTKVGLIALVGLITKHGILMVEFANARREEGVTKAQAIEEAARVRLRPILMTTAAMVMGVMPLVFSSGAGAAARSSIGIVIASGISIGTLFTLFVVPTFYTLLTKSDKRTVPIAVREEDKRGRVAASNAAAE